MVEVCAAGFIPRYPRRTQPAHERTSLLAGRRRHRWRNCWREARIFAARDRRTAKLDGYGSRIRRRREKSEESKTIDPIRGFLWERGAAEHHVRPRNWAEKAASQFLAKGLWPHHLVLLGDLLASESHARRSRGIAVRGWRRDVRQPTSPSGGSCTGQLDMIIFTAALKGEQTLSFFRDP